MRSLRPRSRRSQRGIALIEALVAILIFAFGIVGLVGMQANMTRAQGASKSRADASYLAAQVLGKMWADRTNLAQYSTSGGCSSYQPCKDWTDKVAATLPAGTAQIAVTPGTGDVSLQIRWSTASEGTHAHVLTTTIN
jgi:type IV pilus assembly protein PilV